MILILPSIITVGQVAQPLGRKKRLFCLQLKVEPGLSRHIQALGLLALKSSALKFPKEEEEWRTAGPVLVFLVTYSLKHLGRYVI